MIKPIVVQGSRNTAWHDFKFRTSGMKLFIDGTHYTSANKELFVNYVEEMTTSIKKVWNEELQDYEEIEKQGPTGIKIPLEGVEVEIKAGYAYEVWLCEDGVLVLTKELKNAESHFDRVPDNAIDRLAWFSVPEGTTSLNDVEINVIEIREG